MNPTTLTRTDLDARLLDLLCPLCSQVIHVGLRGGVPHDAACRSTPQIRSVVDDAEEDLSAHGSHRRPWGPQHGIHATPRVAQVIEQLRASSMLGIPLSTAVRRPGVGGALLAPSEGISGPGQSLAHWQTLVLSRAGLIPQSRSVVLRATVELSRVRYDQIFIHAGASLVQKLQLNEEVVLSQHPQEPTPARWHPPGTLVTLHATNSGNLLSAVDVVVLVSVHFAGCAAPP